MPTPRPRSGLTSGSDSSASSRPARCLWAIIPRARQVRRRRVRVSQRPTSRAVRGARRRGGEDRTVDASGGVSRQRRQRVRDVTRRIHGIRQPARDGDRAAADAGRQRAGVQGDPRPRVRSLSWRRRRARAVDLQDARGDRPHDSVKLEEHILQFIFVGTATSFFVSRTLSRVTRSSLPTRSPPVRREPA